MGVAAGQGVVADEGDAVRGQVMAHRGHKRLARDFGDPGIEPVGDHIIESAGAEVCVGEIPRLQPHVRQPQRADDLAAPLDRPF